MLGVQAEIKVLRNISNCFRELKYALHLCHDYKSAYLNENPTLELRGRNFKLGNIFGFGTNSSYNRLG